MLRPLLFLVLALAGALGAAQAAFQGVASDELRVTSPNGQIDFRIFIAVPEPGGSSRIAYQVFYRGKRLMDQSLMGLDIYPQEPLLGENAGVLSSREYSGGDFHGLFVQYLQNGSTGRAINVEIRAFDAGVAFRYVVPKSALLREVLIADEVTEFRFARDGAVSMLDPKSLLDLPFVTEQPGAGWVSISEVRPEGYPRMSLARSGGTTLITRLALKKDEPHLAFEGMAPLTCAWRVLAIAADRETLTKFTLADKLR